MKVLILSVTAGYGHHATAQAIGDMLKNKGAEVDTLDVYAYISNLIKTTIDKGYLFSSKHMQTLYRLVYQLAENNGASYFSSAPSIINIINALGATKFARVISDREPDVIICTHVFAAQMVDELKKYDSEDIFVIGGESIYRQLLPYCTKAYVTKIDHAYDADTYFPNLDADPEWEMTKISDEQTYFDLEYKFVRYERNK